MIFNLSRLYGQCVQHPVNKIHQIMINDLRKCALIAKMPKGAYYNLNKNMFLICGKQMDIVNSRPNSDNSARYVTTDDLNLLNQLTAVKLNQWQAINWGFATKETFHSGPNIKQSYAEPFCDDYTDHSSTKSRKSFWKRACSVFSFKRLFPQKCPTNHFHTPTYMAYSDPAEGVELFEKF